MKLFSLALLGIASSQNVEETTQASTTNPEYEYEYYIDGIEERGKRKKKKKNKNKQQNNSLNNYIATTPTTTTTRITLPPNAYAASTSPTTKSTTTTSTTATTTKYTTTTKSTTTSKYTTTTKYNTKKPKKPKIPYAPKPSNGENQYPEFNPAYGTSGKNSGYSQAYSYGASYGNAQDDNKNGLSCFHCDAPNFEECYRIGELIDCQDNAGSCMIEVRKRGGKMESVCMGCKQKRACKDNKAQNFGRFWQCRPKATSGPSVCRQCCNTPGCTDNFDPPNYKGWNENLLT